MYVEDRAKKMEILRSYLKYPGESPLVDYKAAVQFKERNEFSHKLVKHALGMANAGGGYLVIGYREDKSKIPLPDTNLTKEIVASYEATRIAQFINSYIEGDEKIELQLWKVDYERMQYPIIEIREFTESPFFCSKSTNDGILKGGYLYFRDSATRTIKIAGPSEWRQLIEICVKKKHEYVLSQIRDLFKEVGMLGLYEKGVSAHYEAMQDWIEEKRVKMRNLIISRYNGESQVGFWEFVHWLPDYEKIFNQQTLLEVSEKSQLHNTGWPIGVVLYNQEHKPIPTKEGIEAVIVSKIFGSIDYWFFRKDGSYYFARVYEEDRVKRVQESEKKVKRLLFDVFIWRVAEALLHCVKLNTILGLSTDERIIIKFSWFGLSNRTLGSSTRRLISPRMSSAMDESWEKETTLGELSSKWEDFTIEAVNKVFLLFDYLTIKEKILKEIIEEFKNSRF